MPVEKSAGAVVFRCGSGNKIEYLVLGKHEKSWGFPKGLIERGEKLEEAARRETEEETGLKDLVFIDGFKQTIRFFMKVKYPYQIQRGMKAGETAMKFVTYFLMESKGKNVRISCEHNYFEWLSFDQALARLKRPMDQEVLKKVNDFINDRISKKKVYPVRKFMKITKTKKESSKFSNRVYSVVAKIPKGQVLTYKQVAKLAGRPKAYRAVGNILNKNRDSRVPCHRVIRSDGQTGGFNRGAKNKRLLLLAEGAKIK